MHFMFSEYATILFRLKIRTAKPTKFQFKNKLSTVREIETSFKRYDLNGSGRLTKADMQRANEFTPHEVREFEENCFVFPAHLNANCAVAKLNGLIKSTSIC